MPQKLKYPKLVDFNLSINFQPYKVIVLSSYFEIPSFLAILLGIGGGTWKSKQIKSQTL